MTDICISPDSSPVKHLKSFDRSRNDRHSQRVGFCSTLYVVGGFFHINNSIDYMARLMTNNIDALPVLYSFRRCPYAMRARLAIAYSGTQVQLREIILKAKPAEMLAISPKGTVPILQTSSGQVIEESLDIMHWALSQNDPGMWFPEELAGVITGLITDNDTQFKPWLDRYKYADRFPEQTEIYYRSQCEAWFARLEANLQQHGCLVCERLTLADYALFPFIRQCAHVDKAWFFQTQYHRLQAWLNTLIESELFTSVMKKYPLWSSEDTQTAVVFP